VPDLPLAYLPRGIDHSSGGQVWIPEGAVGPLGGLLVHLSFGAGTAMVLLRDEVAGQQQGAILPLAVSFRSGSPLSEALQVAASAAAAGREGTSLTQVFPRIDPPPATCHSASAASSSRGKSTSM